MSYARFVACLDPRPDQRIIVSDHLYLDETRISVSLTAVDLKPDGPALVGPSRSRWPFGTASTSWPRASMLRART
jgi:hypothetical protein